MTFRMTPYPGALRLVLSAASLGLALAVAGNASADPSGTPPSSLPPGHPTTQGMPPGHPPAGGAAAAGVSGVTGTVLDTMDAGGYTYMKLKTADGETWAAVKQAKVTVGSTVTIVNPMPMDGFESKTLDRRFDRILFGALAAPAAGADDAAVRASMAAQHAAAATGAEADGRISVTKAEGPEGRTVAEVFAQRAALKGKKVAVRGMVVKFSPRIMGKNWVHLRDGSGTAEGKDNDLTVTTGETVAKGEIVLVRGVLSVDRDFGGGYTYRVVVEDAQFSK